MNTEKQACQDMIDTNASSLQLMVKLCADKVAFEARTSKRLNLDMAEVKRTLERSKRYEVVLDTPYMIIMKSGKAEITLSRDGRMLIKRVPNQAEATKVAEEILSATFK